MDQVHPLEPHLASLNDKEWQPLHPASIAAERFGAVIFLGVLAVAALVGMVIAFFFSGLSVGSLAWIALGVATFLLVLGLLFWFSPVWSYRAYRWREVGQGIEIQRGYIWWHRIYVPRERIQHTDVVRGPVMRRFGISTLVIHTAGSHNHTVQIDGLAAEIAESLRESLLPNNQLPSPNGPFDDSKPLPMPRDLATDSDKHRSTDRSAQGVTIDHFDPVVAEETAVNIESTPAPKQES